MRIKFIQFFLNNVGWLNRWLVKSLVGCINTSIVFRNQCM